MTGRTVHFGPGDLITQENRMEGEVYLLEEGTCSVMVHGEELNLIRPGEFFGEIAVLDEGTRTATVRAREACRLRVYAGDSFREAISADPELRERLLRHLAQLARTISEREARVRQEHRDLKKLQSVIVPPYREFTTDPRFRAEAALETSSYAGGDYYDMVPCGPDEYLILVGDSSGHDAAASAIMFITQTLVRQFAAEIPSLPLLFERLHEHLVKQALGDQYYITLCAIRLNAARRTAQLLNAGHPRPLLVRAGEVRELGTRIHLPLGMDIALPGADPRESAFQSEEIALRPGDRMLLFTDGIIEASGQRELRPVDLGRFVLESGPAEGRLVQRLMRELKSASGWEKFPDDCTLLLVQLPHHQDLPYRNAGA